MSPSTVNVSAPSATSSFTPPPLPSSSRVGAAAALQLLHRGGLTVAPHVAARIDAAVAGDSNATLEIARLLGRAQLLGLSALPDPLPLCPAVDSAVRAELTSLDEPARAILLHASVSVSDRTEAVLMAAGATMGEAISSRVPDYLAIAAGRFSFVDPRVRIWVHESASLADRTAAHAAIALAHASLGEERFALWHRALSTLDGDRELVAPLVSLAREAHLAGESEWAHAVAREAACHAVGGEAMTAQTMAGIAALGAGLVDDAVDWLRAPATSDDFRVSAAALAPFVHASTIREGQVPEGPIEHHLARCGSAGGSADDDVAAAVVLAICLHAERGGIREARDLARRSEPLLARHRDGARLAALAGAWCALFDTLPSNGSDGIDEHRPPDAPGGFEMRAEIERALTLGRHDLTAGALRALHSAGHGALRPEGPATAPAWGARRPSPLEEADRHVARSLLLLWSGDIRRARDDLQIAAESTPIGLAFGGLGVALARRLDLFVTGEAGRTAIALEATAPTSARHLGGDLLVDRAIRAYFEGRLTESATLLSLAHDGAIGTAPGMLHLPGLDEAPIWAEAGRMQEARHALSASGNRPRGSSPMQEDAARIRSLVAVADDSRLEAAVDSAIRTARHVLSPFERSRIELVLGRRLMVAGALTLARRHLVGATRLFTQCGALAWAAAAQVELDALPAEPDGPPRDLAAAAPLDPGSSSGWSASASLSASAERALSTAATDAASDGTVRTIRWSAALTEREREVAALVAAGVSNREAARRLYLSVRTVEVHLGRVFSKLGVHSRVELALLAHRASAEAPT